MSWPVAHSWSRIEEWLRSHAPETLDSLNPPVDQQAITALETAIGEPLPEDLVASLLIHDGTDPAARCRFEVVGGFSLLCLADMESHWRMLNKILSDQDTQNEDFSMLGHWWHPSWLPIADFGNGDAYVVDLRPDTHGVVGEFMHEDSTQFDTAPSVAALLADTADLLEGLRTDDREVPVVESGRLRWAFRDELAPQPRSLLAMADGEQPPPPVPRSVDPADWILGGQGLRCLTFARGLSEAELVRRFGGDPDRLPGLTGEDVAARQLSWRCGYRPMLRVGKTAGFAFGFELGHMYGVGTPMLRRVSAGTSAVSLAYTGLITQLAVAEDGVVVLRFDSTRPEELGGADPDRFRPLLEQAGLLPFDPERYVEDEAVLGLALALRLGPGEFDPAVLAGPLPAATLLPLRPEPFSRPHPVQSDPDLITVIEFATDEQLRTAVLAVARRRADELGLDAYPAIGAALHSATPGPVDDDSPLGRTARELAAEGNAAMRSRLDFSDPAARGLLTDPERATWHQRARLAEALSQALAGPVTDAAYVLVEMTNDFPERGEFLAALSSVDVPADAVARLERAEQERRAASMARPVRHPRMRR
jgi:cell wall assembly regulator SMI1